MRVCSLSFLCGGKRLKTQTRLQSVELCTLSASAFSYPEEDRPILVRDFIHDALYHPHRGYFSVRSGAVGRLPEPITFDRLKGRRQYMQQLSELYKQNDISWFTPAELFKPWYGYALAKYMITHHTSKFPLQIFEIGGGTGTCAKNILDYVKKEAPSIYHNMHYVSVEISKALADTQLQSVHAEETHKSHHSVDCRDACKRTGWGKADERPCFVILLEVLDNQPHDLIYKENSSCQWLETRITKGHDSAALIEVHQPVKDPLIQRCIEIMESGTQSLPSWLLSAKNFFHKAFPSPKKAWIPTASLVNQNSLLI
eukprot:c22327_g1_i2 orf=102-1040(+)